MKTSFLMCRPEYYGIDYVINPWMDVARQPDAALALSQWEALRAILEGKMGCRVLLVEPRKGQPDMVFTANAGYLEESRFVPSRFRHPERRGEEAHFIRWFSENGYEICHLNESGGFFEGFGDALPLGEVLFSGYRFRSDISSHRELGKIFNRRVISLELVDSRFYHLDTCFCPLPSGELIYFPGAFDSYGLKVIEETAGRKNLIAVDDKEAVAFCCNAVAVGRDIVINSGAPLLATELGKRGFNVFETDLSEFIKSGGSAKCLTLKLGKD